MRPDFRVALLALLLTLTAFLVDQPLAGPGSAGLPAQAIPWR